MALRLGYRGRLKSGCRRTEGWLTHGLPSALPAGCIFCLQVVFGLVLGILLSYIYSRLSSRYRWFTVGIPSGYRWGTVGMPLGYRGNDTTDGKTIVVVPAKKRSRCSRVASVPVSSVKTPSQVNPSKPKEIGNKNESLFKGDECPCCVRRNAFPSKLLETKGNRNMSLKQI